MKYLAFPIFIVLPVLIASKLPCDILSEYLEENGLKVVLIETALTRQDVHLSSRGGNNAGIFQGVLNGKEIVVKRVYTGHKDQQVVDDNLDNLKREIEFTKELSELGIAPKFFGVFRFEDGSYGIVSEKIYPSWVARGEGHNDDQLPTAMKEVSRSTIESWKVKMTNITNELTERGIFAEDLQFLVTPSGKVYAIDFGHYRRPNDRFYINQNQLLLNTFYISTQRRNLIRVVSS